MWQALRINLKSRKNNIRTNFRCFWASHAIHDFQPSLKVCVQAFARTTESLKRGVHKWTNQNQTWWRDLVTWRRFVCSHWLKFKLLRCAICSVRKKPRIMKLAANNETRLEIICAKRQIWKFVHFKIGFKCNSIKSFSVVGLSTLSNLEVEESLTDRYI